MRDDIEIRKSGYDAAPIRLVMISTHGDETSKCLDAADAMELAADLIHWASKPDQVLADHIRNRARALSA